MKRPNQPPKLPNHILIRLVHKLHVEAQCGMAAEMRELLEHITLASTSQCLTVSEVMKMPLASEATNNRRLKMLRDHGWVITSTAPDKRVKYLHPSNAAIAYLNQMFGE